MLYQHSFDECKEKLKPDATPKKIDVRNRVLEQFPEICSEAKGTTKFDARYKKLRKLKNAIDYIGKRFPGYRLNEDIYPSSNIRPSNSSGDGTESRKLRTTKKDVDYEELPLKPLSVLKKRDAKLHEKERNATMSPYAKLISELHEARLHGADKKMSRLVAYSPESVFLTRSKLLRYRHEMHLQLSVVANPDDMVHANLQPDTLSLLKSATDWYTDGAENIKCSGGGSEHDEYVKAFDQKRRGRIMNTNVIYMGEELGYGVEAGEGNISSYINFKQG